MRTLILLWVPEQSPRTPGQTEEIVAQQYTILARGIEAARPRPAIPSFGILKGVHDSPVLPRKDAPENPGYDACRGNRGIRL